MVASDIVHRAARHPGDDDGVADRRRGHRCRRFGEAGVIRVRSAGRAGRGLGERLSRANSPGRPPRCMQGRRASLPFPQLRKRGGPRSRTERHSHLVRSERDAVHDGDARNCAEGGAESRRRTSAHETVDLGRRAARAAAGSGLARAAEARVCTRPGGVPPGVRGIPAAMVWSLGRRAVALSRASAPRGACGPRRPPRPWRPSR
jgi:hypothetical protein